MNRSIYLIRHGQPEFPGGVKRCIGGGTDLPLSEQGRRQLRETAAFLEKRELSLIWSSPLSRARESAELVARGSVPIRICEGLSEIQMGRWENHSFDELRRLYPEQYAERGKNLGTFRPEGGESFEECSVRAAAAFSEILLSPGNLAVAAHAGFNRALLSYLTARPLTRLLEIEQPYGGVTSIEQRGEELRVLGLVFSPGC